MMMASTILIIDDDRGILDMLEIALRRRSYNVIAVTDIRSGLQKLDENDIDMILCDLYIGDETGIDFLRSVKEADSEIPVVIITGHPDVESVAESLRLQAFDYLKKPIQHNEIYRVIEKGLAHRALTQSKHQLEIELENYHRLLQKRIDDKTSELQRTNENLRTEIKTRKQAEDSQKEINERLKKEIIDRERIEAKLRESENRYRMMFEKMSSGVAIYEARNDGSDFIVRDVNRAAEKIEKIDRHEVIGKKVSEVFPAVSEFGILDVFKSVWKSGKSEDFPISFYKDDRISGWRDNHIYRLPSNEIVAIYTDVTKQKQAEEALRVSEERFQMAMEAANEGLWDYNMKTGKMHFSPRWYTMLGYAPYELPPSFDTWHGLLHPEDRKQSQNDIDGKIKNGGMFKTEFRMRSKTGEWKSIVSSGKVFSRDESGNPIRIVGTHTDVTEQKRSEAQLRQALSDLDQIFNSASDGMCLVDMDSNILKINKMMSRFFGWEERWVWGKPFFDLLPPYEYRFAESPTDPEINRIVHDLTFTLTDGRSRHMTLTATPFKDSDGEISGFLYNIRDITKRVEVEKESEDRKRQITQADKMKSLGILVSGVAHEINNPNNFIMLNTSILMKVWDDLLPILEKRYVENGDFLLANIPYSQMKTHIPELFDGLMDGSKRIRSLISDLKDYSRGSASDAHEIVDLNRVVEKSISLMQTLIRNSTAFFKLCLAENLPFVRGNFHRLEQVVINLIENACQASTSRDQGISVETFHDPMTNRTALKIRDEGTGIPKENLGEILDPFFTTKRDSGGTGLGLSVCAGIVKEHNGEITFDSEVGKGTTVSVAFPSVSSHGSE